MTPDQIYRRAGGRRAYNNQRKIIAEFRQFDVIKICIELGQKRGWQAEAARRLNVGTSTISRDFKSFLRSYKSRRREQERDKRRTGPTAAPGTSIG